MEWKGIKNIKQMILKSKKTNEKNERRRVKRIRATTSPTTQNSLFFTELEKGGTLDIVDGLYSDTYDLGEVNYDTALEDDKIHIVSKLNDAINLLSEKDHYQLTLHAQKNPKERYLEENNFPELPGYPGVLSKEWNAILEDRYDHGRNNFKVSRYITLSTQGENLENGRNKLEDLGGDFDNELREIEAPFRKLDGLERLHLMNEILRPGKPLYGTWEDIEHSRLTAKDLIAPGHLEFRRSKIDFEIDDHIGQILYLRDFPRNLKDTMFRDLIRTGVEMVLTIHGTAYSISETNKRLRNQATDIESEVITRERKASAKQYSTQHIARSAKEDKKEVDEQIEFVTETGDKQFSSLFLVYIWAEDRTTLQQYISKIDGVASKHGAVFSPLYLVQEEALNSVLPLGKNYVDIEKNYLRDLVTPNLSINSPFTSVDIQHRGGKYYGINLLSKNNILINRKDDAMANGNGGIVGLSGSGKSMAAKAEMISTYLRMPKDEVIVVDVEGEYTPIGRALNAQIIPIAPGSSANLNIMDLPKAGNLAVEDDPIALKSDFLLSIFGNLLGGLTASQETLIDAVTKRTYEQYKTPSLTDWYQVLKTAGGAVAEQLASDLGLYVTGSLNMFAKPTNVNLNSRFTIYNIKNLGAKFKAFGFMVIMDKIWNKVVEAQAKGITVWVYFDEFQTVLNASQLPMLREKAADIYARIRKYGSLPTFMTQSAETVLSTPEGRSIFFNSDFLILLKQKSDVFDLLVKNLKLTPRQASYLKNPPLGGGLIVAGNSIVPFSNVIPQETELFKIMNTKA